MKFTLKIALGNDFMLSGYDVANALRKVSDKLIANYDCEIDSTCSGVVFDDNGNSVGTWTFDSNES